MIVKNFPIKKFQSLVCESAEEQAKCFNTLPFDFPDDFPEDDQKKIRALVDKVSGLVVLIELAKFINECHSGGVNEIMNLWWDDISHLLRNPYMLDDKPWNEDMDPWCLFNDDFPVGGECAKNESDLSDPGTAAVVLAKYLTHNDVAKEFWDIFQGEINMEDFEYWLDTLIDEKGVKVDTEPQVTDNLDKAVNKVVEHLFNSSGDFLPITVQRGRKWRGNGYVTQSKVVNAGPTWAHEQMEVNTVWDPTTKKLEEFNGSVYARGSNDGSNGIRDWNPSESEIKQAARDYTNYWIAACKKRCGDDMKWRANYLRKVLGISDITAWDIAREI